MKKLKTLISPRSGLIMVGFLFIASTLMSLSSSVSVKDTSWSLFDAISHKDIIDFKITSDFENLKNNRKFQEDQEAVLSFKDQHGDQHQFSVDLSLRGVYRRSRSEGIPPLMIEFKKKELKSLGYSKYDDLKLVTYFYEDKKISKEFLIREYLIYKLYNAISEYSYRVQLVNLEVEDVNTGKKDKQMGFVIEDTDELRNRIGANKLDDSVTIAEENFHKIQSQIVCVFQYMIGNSDWSIFPRRNVKFFVVNEQIIMVPYDFDFSGTVNAPYAVPDNFKNIKSIRERIYIGFKDDLEALTPVLKLFDRKKEKLLSIVNDTRKLSPDSRYEITNYIKGFYEDIEMRKKEKLALPSF